MLKAIAERNEKVRNNILQQFSGKKIYTDLILQDINGKVLFLKRSNTDDFMAGKWCLPGGKLEADETPVQGALRETAEETKLDYIKDKAEIIRGPELIKIYKPEKGVTIHYTYLNVVSINNIILDQNEHEQWIIEDPEVAIDTLEFIPGIVRIIYEIFLEPLYGKRRSQESSNSSNK